MSQGKKSAEKRQRRLQKSLCHGGSLFEPTRHPKRETEVVVEEMKHRSEDDLL